ncbi:MAG: flagellar protein FlbD [Neglectibacter sp.]
MIVLTKRSKEQFVMNHLQIECIEHSRGKDHHDEPRLFWCRKPWRRSFKIAEYNAKVQDIHREITVTDRR